MKRIDAIIDINKKCTGCAVCADACPKGCISIFEDDEGFLRAKVKQAGCVECGACFNVCPAEKNFKNQGEQQLYAAYAKDPNVRSGGSSGGIFELIASDLIDKGYYVCGAAFDGIKLQHKVVNTKEDLKLLLKSKYVQSATCGIYKSVRELLKQGEKVFFCGTPCQVSALLNYIPDLYKDSLFTADIVCHGVPAQKFFDLYIESLEKNHGCRVSDFSFRVKDNKYKHAHGYSYKLEKNGKTTIRNGIYEHSTFYNAFKRYLFLRESCYQCNYCTLERVSDITLADFWGIEKYDFDGDTDAGVSMIIVNTSKGKKMYDAIGNMIVSKNFPLGYGIESNYCLTHSTVKPKNRDAVVECIKNSGYDVAAKRYFGTGILHRMYWMVPRRLRCVIKKLRW